MWGVKDKIKVKDKIVLNEKEPVKEPTESFA
jgi:hypothetical protein